MNEVLLERALRDLSRIEDEATRAGGDLSVLACLADMAADEAREQLSMLKQQSQKQSAESVAEAFFR
jgi:hypothetical protein